MTLMLLAIAAVVLAATARSSMGLAVSAVHARQDLRRRWGNQSIRLTTLDLAPSLFEGIEAETDKPTISLDAQFNLSGQTYYVTVSDEQAKVNINALLQHKGRDATRSFARGQFTDSLGSSDIYLPVDQQAQSSPTEGADAVLNRKIVSINHLLPGFDPDHDPESTSYLMVGLTCWGDGRIHIRRASDDLIREIAAPILGSIQIERLRDTMANNDGQELNELLVVIGTREQDIPGLMQRLTMDSYCYSVWIAVDNGRRRWHELGVMELKPDEIAEPGGADTNEQIDASNQSPVTGSPVAPKPSDLPRTQAGGDSVSTESTAPATLPPASDDSGKYPRLRVYQW